MSNRTLKSSASEDSAPGLPRPVHGSLLHGLLLKQSPGGHEMGSMFGDATSCVLCTASRDLL